MRICIISTGYPIADRPAVSGLHTANQTLARGLAAAGHGVDVVTFSGKQDWEDNGVSVHHVPQPNLHYYLGKMPLLGRLIAQAAKEVEISYAMYRAVLRLHADRKFDIIEGTEDASTFTGRLNQHAATVIRLHGDTYTFFRYTPGTRISTAIHLCRIFQRIGLRRVHHLISPSAAHAVEIAHEIHRTPDDISIIPHDLPFGWSLGHDPEIQNVVLYVGRLERRKGILDALRSFRGVLNAYPEMQLVVIGPRHATVDPRLIGGIIDELHLKDNVQLLGGLPQEQVIPWYKRARIFLFPSYYESFGLVALEAMACGLPVVGYCAGSIPEVVRDNSTGLLVEPGNIDGLSDKMCQLIADDTRWKTMSLAAVQAVEEYRHARAVTQTELVYSRLIEKCRSLPGK